MEFSKRLDLFGDEIFSALNQRKVALEAQGRTLFNLSVGTPDFEAPAHVKQALMDAAKNQDNWKYSLRDLPELLDAVCSYYQRRFGVAITPDQVMSVNGSQEGMGHLGLALFLMAASELPAALLFPHLWRRLGSRGMMVLSVVFMALKPLLFLLTPSLGCLLLIQPIQMLGYGLFTPASVYYANENVSPADRVRGQAVMMMASNGLGGMAGNLIAGYAIDLGGVNAMLALCALIGAAGVWFAILAARSAKKA